MPANRFPARAPRDTAGVYAKGVPALYTSLSPLTALRESNQAGALQPTTLVCYDADIEAIFDGRDAQALAREGMDAAGIAAPSWRDEMKMRGEARSQSFARRLAKRCNGVLVRSFAFGAAENDLNLVLWTWGNAAPARLALIDDEGRLSREITSD